jgi:hypothetical protein
MKQEQHEKPRAYNTTVAAMEMFLLRGIILHVYVETGIQVTASLWSTPARLNLEVLLQ